MFLALAMIFTAIPMNALAAEVDVTDQAETILEEEGEKVPKMCLRESLRS